MEAFPRCATLPVMCEDRLANGRRASVVKKSGADTRTPQWRRSHLAAIRVTLLDSVTQAAHIVKEKI